MNLKKRYLLIDIIMLIKIKMLWTTILMAGFYATLSMKISNDFGISMISKCEPEGRY